MKLTRQTNFTSKETKNEKIHEYLKTLFARCEGCSKPYPGKLVPKRSKRDLIIAQLHEVIDHAEKVGVSTVIEPPPHLGTVPAPSPAPPLKGGLGREPSGRNKLIPDEISQAYPPGDRAEPENNVKRLCAICYRLRDGNLSEEARERGLDIVGILDNIIALPKKPHAEFEELLRFGRAIEVELCDSPTDEEVQAVLKLVRVATEQQLQAVNSTLGELRPLDEEMIETDVTNLPRSLVQDCINELDTIGVGRRQKFVQPPRHSRPLPSLPERTEKMTTDQLKNPSPPDASKTQLQEELKKAQEASAALQEELKTARKNLEQARLDMHDPAKFISRDKLSEYVNQEAVAKQLGMMTVARSDQLIKEARELALKDHVTQTAHEEGLKKTAGKYLNLGIFSTAGVALILFLSVAVIILSLGRGARVPADTTTRTNSSASSGELGTGQTAPKSQSEYPEVEEIRAQIRELQSVE